MPDLRSTSENLPCKICPAGKVIVALIPDILPSIELKTALVNACTAMKDPVTFVLVAKAGGLPSIAGVVTIEPLAPRLFLMFTFISERKFYSLVMCRFLLEYDFADLIVRPCLFLEVKILGLELPP